MALNRITGLGMVVLGSSMLMALACDSGGTTASPNNGGGNSIFGNTGGADSSSGGASAITGNTGGAMTGSTGGAKATGGSTGSSSLPPQGEACVNLTPPTATGSLSISAGYVTAGTLKGYGFTWVGEKSNDTTCVTPQCNETSGCKPAFGTSAICAAGVVTADTTYNSVVGIGFNLNQASSGGTPGTVAAPASVTVSATVGSGTGDANARIQLVTAAGDSYCVKEGTWTSGTAVPIEEFYPSCWNVGTTDDPGTPLAAGAEINAIDIVVPSDSTADRPFSICLTGVTM